MYFGGFFVNCEYFCACDIAVFHVQYKLIKDSMRIQSPSWHRNCNDLLLWCILFWKNCEFDNFVHILELWFVCIYLHWRMISMCPILYRKKLFDFRCWWKIQKMYNWNLNYFLASFHGSLLWIVTNALQFCLSGIKKWRRDLTFNRIPSISLYRHYSPYSYPWSYHCLIR